MQGAQCGGALMNIKHGAVAQERSAPAGSSGDEMGPFVAQVLGSTEDVWSELFREQSGAAYRPPRLVLFTGLTSSACGTAQSAMGPFYCPNDRKIYLDTSFFTQLRARFNACPPRRGNRPATSRALA